MNNLFRTILGVTLLLSSTALAGGGGQPVTRPTPPPAAVVPAAPAEPSPLEYAGAVAVAAERLRRAGNAPLPPTDCRRGALGVPLPAGLRLADCSLIQSAVGSQVRLTTTSGRAIVVGNDTTLFDLPLSAVGAGQSDRELAFAYVRDLVTHSEAARARGEAPAGQCAELAPPPAFLTSCRVVRQPDRTVVTLETGAGLRLYFDGQLIRDLGSQPLPELK